MAVLLILAVGIAWLLWQSTRCSSISFSKPGRAMKRFNFATRIFCTSWYISAAKRNSV